MDDVLKSIYEKNNIFFIFKALRIAFTPVPHLCTMLPLSLSTSRKNMNQLTFFVFFCYKINVRMHFKVLNTMFLTMIRLIFS